MSTCKLSLLLFLVVYSLALPSLRHSTIDFLYLLDYFLYVCQSYAYASQRCTVQYCMYILHTNFSYSRVSICDIDGVGNQCQSSIQLHCIGPGSSSHLCCHWPSAGIMSYCNIQRNRVGPVALESARQRYQRPWIRASADYSFWAWLPS